MKIKTVFGGIIKSSVRLEHVIAEVGEPCIECYPMAKLNEF